MAARKLLTIAPKTERPDPPKISSVREKIRAQRHLAAMRKGPGLQPDFDRRDPNSLGTLPHRGRRTLEVL